MRISAYLLGAALLIMRCLRGPTWVAIAEMTPIGAAGSSDHRTVISLHRPRLVDRVAVGSDPRRNIGPASRSLLMRGLTEYQIYTLPNCILTADIAGLVCDPGVDARDHLRCHTYGNALFQSQSSIAFAQRHSKPQPASDHALLHAQIA